MHARGIRLVTVLLLALLAAAPRASADEGQALARVRSSQRRIVNVLREGYRRSKTFRRLVDRLATTDVIVYVEAVHYLQAPMHGCLQFAGIAGQQRYLRVTVKSQLGADRLIALIGHELQHANEVADAAEVVNDQTLTSFYQRIGEPSINGWDSPAARGVGDIVFEELLSKGRPAAADPASPALPAVLPGTVIR